MKKVFLIMTSAAILSGCAGMNNDFDCNKTASDQCLTMEQAQGLASHGKSLDDLDSTKGGAEKKAVTERVATAPLSNTRPVLKPYSNPVVSGTSVKSNLISQRIQTVTERVVEKVNLNSAGSVNAVRYQDVTQRLWISPWVDKDDSFHQPSIVEFVTEKSAWKKDFKTIGSGD